MSEEEKRTTEDIDNELVEKYGDLLDVNQEIINESRRRALEMQKLQELFTDQADRCDEIAALHIQMARTIGESFASIIANEWGIVEEEQEEDSSEEDGNGEDGNSDVNG